MDNIAIYTKALEAAKAAEHDYRQQHGEGFMCGFAWIYFPNGRDKFVNWLKKNNIGDKHWQKGYEIWNVTKCGSQSIDLKEHSSRVFAAVLREHGIQCMAQSRLD